METGEVYSEWQKRTVKVHYVGARLGAWMNVNDAILQANKGDRIEVSSGRYTESIIVNKEIELVACEGETPDVIFRGTVLTITGTDKCFISGLEMVQNDRNKDCPCVSIAEGSPIITNCKFSSVLVTGTATPHIERNEISGSMTTSGIRLRNKCGGTFIKNQIFSHELWCVDVSNCGNTVFEDNNMLCPEPNPHKMERRGKGIFHIGTADHSVIEGETLTINRNTFNDHTKVTSKRFMERTSVVVDDGSCHILFTDNSFMSGNIGMVTSADNIVVEDNLFSKQQTTGIVIEAGTPNVSTNRFCDCQGSAITISSSNPIVEWNTITGSPTGGHGILVRQQACPVVSNNTILRVAKVALRIDNSCGIYSNNTFDMSSGPTIMVMSSKADPVVSNNTILNAGMQAIAVVNEARGTYTGNTIENASTGIAAFKKSNPTFTQNTITECAKEGIIIAKNGLGVYSDNRIESCNIGLAVTGSSKPEVVGNFVGYCTSIGIHITDFSQGKYHKNTIRENRTAGMKVDQSADPTCTRNRLEKNPQHGLLIVNGLGTYLDNYLDCNRFTNICVSGSLSNPVVRKNTLVSCEAGDSLLAEDGAQGTFEKNFFQHSPRGVTIVGENTNPKILRCEFGAHMISGVIVKENGKGRFRNCSFQGIDLGCELTGGATTLISNCKFDRAKRALQISGEGTSPSITSSTIVSSDDCAIHTSDGASPEIKNSLINICGTGIKCVDNSSPVITSNILSNNPIAISSSSGSNPRVSENEFSGASETAALINEGGKGSYFKNVFSSSAVGVSVEGATGEARFTQNIIKSNTWGIRSSLDRKKLGDAEFHKNEICESAMVNVLVENYGHVIIEGNNIHTAPLGVLCRNEGCGIFTKNHIHTHSVANFRVITSADPEVTSNTIERSLLGIEVTDKGKGTFTSNIFLKNDIHLSVMNGGDPYVTDCELSSNPTGSGLIIRNGGFGTYTENRFLNNFKSGIQIGQNSKPKITNNKLIDNNEHGIHIMDGALGLITNNTMCGNGHSGVFISTDADPTITDNRMTKNKCGIEIIECGKGTFIRNSISDNTLCGVLLRARSDPLLDANMIFNERIGIDFLDGSLGQILNNSIYDNERGMQLSTAAAPVVASNKFVENLFGIRFTDDASGDIQHNIFTNNDISCEVWEGAAPIVCNNQYNGRGEGIVIKGGFGQFDTNTFEELSCGIRITQPETTVSISANIFRGCKIGITVENEASPTIIENTFTRSTQSGLFVHHSGKPTLSKNVFIAELCGIIFEDESTGHCEGNLFENSDTGIVIKDEETNPLIENNTFNDNEYGIIAHSRSKGKAMLNTFTANHKAGVLLKTKTKLLLERNVFIRHTAVCAISITEEARGAIHMNVIADNIVGVQIQEGGDTQVTENIFKRNTNTAIIATNGGNGLVANNCFKENEVDVRTRHKAQTIFRDNLFSGVKSVQCSDDGGGTFMNCSISGLFVIQTGACPTIIGSHISGTGLLIENNGRGVIQTNTFSRISDGCSAIEITTGGDPIVADNTFWGCSKSVTCKHQGIGEIRDNKFVGGKVGIEILKGGKLVASRCQFEAQERGILISGKETTGKIINCFICVQGVGIWIEKGACPDIIDCNISDARVVSSFR